MIHVYAIARRLDDLPALRGLSDAPVDRMQIHGLDVVVSRVDSATLAPSEEALVRHAQVAEALQPRSEALLPARFGDAFSGEDELVAAIDHRWRELEQALVRVRGCVEFGVRVLSSESHVARPAERRSGREYMERRLRESAKRRALTEQIHTPLSELARASTRSPSRPDVLFTAAYLVPEGATDAFRNRVRRLQAEHRDLAIVCSGPWPPYSFTAETESDA